MLSLLFLGLTTLGCHGMDFEKESFGRISSPDAECKYWTRQTVLVSPSTVATLKSQMVNVKKCATLFQLAGGCMKMKMNCPNFNVPKGPLRWFSISPPGKDTLMVIDQGTGSLTPTS